MRVTYQVKIEGVAPYDVGDQLYPAIKSFETLKGRYPNRKARLIMKTEIVLQEDTYHDR